LHLFVLNHAHRLILQKNITLCCPLKERLETKMDTEIVNTDQGSRFTAVEFTDVVLAKG